ncbi:MAG: OmpP1/FadL family transporter [Niastella sp.]|uniref:OmpP1/FadL family transporter n=1 Tax=Niastella sp. TaxID=1869183 RepID=UPI00389A8F5B
MKYTLSIAFLTLIGSQAMSQLPEDVIRMSWNVPSGTARSQAIGGAIGSLGGEITSTFVNPAGLGFFKVSEIVLTPGFTIGHSDGDYRGSGVRSNNVNRFNMSTTGFVSATSDPGRQWVSKAFSIAVNRAANFNNNIYYKGNNDYSSGSEVYADEFSKSGVNLNDTYGSDKLSLPTKMAIYTYLIDTATIGGIKQIVGRPEYLNSINQENRISTKGGITEIAVGFAGNLQDKFYLGGSIGIPIVKYERRTEYKESDPTNDDNNNFNYYRYEEKLTTTGAGINLKLGAIFKPIEPLRIGLAVHTPTIYGLKDNVTSKMVTDHEKLISGFPVDSVTSDYYAETPVSKYDFSSPWKFMVSGAYIINGVEDVSQQRGFITADIEYVTYGSSRFSAAEESDDNSYYSQVNSTVKQLYKSALNFRFGMEIKFNTIMGRLGFAHYGNPYENNPVKAGKTNVSAGLGYRNKGIFIDLTYVHSLTTDSNFPYRLPPPQQNVYADVKSQIGQILLTLGFKVF